MLMIAIVDGDWRGAIMLRRQMKMENKCPGCQLFLITHQQDGGGG